MTQKIAKPYTNTKKILFMLALVALSIGVWTEFKSLWLQDNGFATATVSLYISLASILTCIVVLFIAFLFKVSFTKKIISISLLIKVISMVGLLMVNNTEYYFLMITLFVLDTVTTNIVIISVYPLIATRHKTNALYSERRLVEFISKDVGFLLGGLLIGFSLGHYVMDYNTCLLFGIAFCLTAFVMMFFIKQKIDTSQPILKPSIKFIFKDKMLCWYLVYVFFINAQNFCIFSVPMLLLTGLIDLSVKGATYCFLLACIIANIVGVLALWKFTPKNDFVSLALRYLVRLVSFVAVVITGNTVVAVVAIFGSMIFYHSFENKLEAPYINAVENNNILMFANIRFAMSYLGTSAGALLFSLCYDGGLSLLFGVASILLVIATLISALLIKEKNKRKKNKTLIGEQETVFEENS